MPSLLSEVDRFRAWAASYPPPRSGEWECDYDEWPALCTAFLAFITDQPFKSWSAVEQRAVLYTVARDNEAQYLAQEIRSQQADLVPLLARASLRNGECDDRWQLAVQLGYLKPDQEIEDLLLAFAKDDHELVRRQALRSLLRVKSSSVEQVAIAQWHTTDSNQEHARMMALFCLHASDSPHLDRLLPEALRAPQPNLRAYADRIQNGDPLE